RVEGLQRLDTDLADLCRTEEGPDVLIEDIPVAALGLNIYVELVHVAVKQIVEGSLRSRVPAFVDLRLELGPGPLGCLLRSRSRGNCLSEVVPLVRHRVDAGVDLHAQ